MPATPLDRQTKGRPPLHVQIASDLRRRIAEGEFWPEGFRAGEQLPAQHSFTSEYGVSKDTVTKAFGLLKTQGVIDSYHGAEAAVQDPRHWKLGDSQRIDALELRIGQIEERLARRASAPADDDETARALDELRGQLSNLQRMVRPLLPPDEADAGQAPAASLTARRNAQAGPHGKN